MKEQYVQYGCGFHAPEAWTNFDASPTLRFERIPALGRLHTKNEQRFPQRVKYGDITRGLPLADNSCTAIYCSHVLEHLALNDLRKALKNTHRVLKRGGIFRLVLPDLEYNIRQYLANPTPDAANEFLRETLLGRAERTKGIRGLIVSVFGNNEHLWMWDFKGLAYELEEAGFHSIRRAMLGDSSDQMFTHVEQADRWKDALGIECRK